MKKFEPSKGKAMMSAIVQEAHSKSELVVAAIAQTYPDAAITLGVIHAGFGARLAYNQEKLNQFTKYLMENREVFTDDLLSSSDFKNGVNVVIDHYFKLRTDSKRRLAEKIFYDFGKSREMPLYPLERYYDTLEKISESGIRFLGFIHHEIPKIQEEFTRAKMLQNGNNVSSKSFEEWLDIYTKREPLPTFIEEFIKVEAEEKASKMSGQANQEALKSIETQLRGDIRIIVSELEQLGLAKSFFQEGLGWSSVGKNIWPYRLWEKIHIHSQAGE